MAPATSAPLACLHALDAGRGVDLDHHRPAVGAQHVDAGDVEAQHLGRAHAPSCARPPRSTTASALPPRCRLARNSPILPERIMLATTCAADHQHADVGAAGLLDVLLHQDVHVGGAEGLDDGLGRGRRLGQDHAAALRALQQLDDAGRAADLLDHVLGAARVRARRPSPAGRCPRAPAAAARAACRASGRWPRSRSAGTRPAPRTGAARPGRSA